MVSFPQYCYSVYHQTPTQPAISKPPLAAKPQAFPHPHQTQPHLMQPTFQQHIPMAEQPMAQTPPYMQQMVQPPVMGGMPVFTPPVSQPAFLQSECLALVISHQDRIFVLEKSG